MWGPVNLFNPFDATVYMRKSGFGLRCVNKVTGGKFCWACHDSLAQFAQISS